MPPRSLLRSLLTLFLLAATLLLLLLPRPFTPLCQLHSAPAVGVHTLHSDGLLEVNPSASHPIYHLIARADALWSQKLRNASRSLDQAVREYRQRYRRNPPLGFDDWWAYVQDNNVLLPDEYDQIFHDLEPFWAIRPADLQHIQREWATRDESYTIAKSANSPIDFVNHTIRGDNATQIRLMAGGSEIINLLADVADFIPPFRAVFSPHDNPSLFTDWELKQLALQAASQRKFIDINNPLETKLHGWISACSPLSNAWADPIHFDPATAPPPSPPHPGKTFIYDHRLTMDPCIHPHLLTAHGQFLSHKTGPVPHPRLIPKFSYSPTTLHHDIMPATPINWVQDILPRSIDPEWDDKVDDRLLWRGRNTGIWHASGQVEEKWWMKAHRERLVQWANTGFGDDIVLLTGAGRRLGSSKQWEYDPVGNGTWVKKGRYITALLDVAFASDPIACEASVCDSLRKQFEFRQMQDLETAGKYKYVLDVDGNAWSSRFKRLITSNSLVFKATIYPEWYTDRIAPWVHYIPIQNDYSDLLDALVFFRGEDGGRGEPELARKIAKAGREWSLRFWRREDLTAYLFRLFLEYARVMGLEREKMDYEG